MSALMQFVCDRKWEIPDERIIHLLLRVEEPGQVVYVQVILQVAVGEHEEVQIPASWHHLVEGAELLKAQSSLVLVCVCLLTKGTGVSLFIFTTVPIIAGL